MRYSLRSRATAVATVPGGLRVGPRSGSGFDSGRRGSMDRTLLRRLVSGARVCTRSGAALAFASRGRVLRAGTRSFPAASTRMRRTGPLPVLVIAPVRHPVRPGCSGGVFARHPSQDAHQLPGGIETGDVPEFGENRDGTEYITEPIKAPQADEGVHHRCEGPGDGGRSDRLVPIGHAPGGLMAGVDVFRKDHPARTGLSKDWSASPFVGACVHRLLPG